MKSDNPISVLFSSDFRSLFLLMAMYALIGPTLWILSWTGQLSQAAAPNPWLHLPHLWHG